jgi:hypothetical protein
MGQADIFRGSRYWRGYPARYRRQIPRVLLNAGCASLLLVFLPLVGAAAWFASGAGLLLKVLFGGLLGSIATWCALAYFRPRSILQVRVLPYFEKHVGKIHTFLAGRALACNWERIDDLARELGWNPLSDFGFADDLDGDSVIWHDAAQGYEAVQAIRQRVELDWVTRDLDLLRDLDTLAHALSRAAEQRIRFSLIVSVGDGTSPMEMTRRAGTFF